MIIFPGKKYELLAAAPDLYGRIYYFISNGEVMSPKAYPKLVAEMVCAAWNGEDEKFYEVAETIDKLEQRLKKTQFIKRHRVIEVLADSGAYEAAMQSLQQGNKEDYSILLTYKEEVLDMRGFMKGKRQDRPDDSLFQSGEYGKLSNGGWFCCPPNTDLVGNLSGHDITEHEDGTITVSPSILIRNHQGGEWHGFLERGVWRKV